MPGSPGDDGLVSARGPGGIDRRTFAGLLLAGLAGVLAVLPYQFALTGWPPREALPVIIALALLQNAVLVGLSVLAGLTLGARVGFRVRRRGSGEAPYGRAAAVGVAVGVLVLALDVAVFAPLVRNAVVGGAGPRATGRVEAALLGLLASLYGGVTEELLLRFGLVSVLAWAGWRLVGRPTTLPDGVAWGAVLVAAVLFGLGHLGATAAAFELTPAVLARMLLLNGLAGVAFGWLYWRVDLIAAMVAHAAADVVLHVVAPLVG